LAAGEGFEPSLTDPEGMCPVKCVKALCDTVGLFLGDAAYSEM
jgi:hypothetical protein